MRTKVDVLTNSLRIHPLQDLPCKVRKYCAGLGTVELKEFNLLRAENFDRGDFISMYLIIIWLDAHVTLDFDLR